MGHKLKVLVAKVPHFVDASLDAIVITPLHKHDSWRATRAQQCIALELLGRGFDRCDFLPRSDMMCPDQRIEHGTPQGD